MEATQLFWLAPVGSLLALVYSYYFYSLMMKADSGNEKSQELVSNIKEGAKAYLLAQYKVTGLFFIIAFALLAFLAYVLDVQSPWTPIAFLSGGLFSALSGYFGMKTSTSASDKTACAAGISLNEALKMAFKSGTVTGFLIVGLGLLDISIWWKVLNYVLDNKEFFRDSSFAINSYTEITTIMLTFGIGASAQALFARVGGGIFAKAAGIGTGIVEKNETGISENDLRNPAYIADRVGDNVCDVVGIGADLYESYCGSILATIALGAAAFNTSELLSLQLNSILLPMAVAGIGVAFSIIGTYSVNTKEEATQKELMESTNRGVNYASFLTAITSVALVNSLLPGHFEIFGCIATGLMAGVIIGWASNYYTSEDYPPTENIAEQSAISPATVVLEGISTGMISTAIPVITICIAILLAYGFANGFNNPSMGLYGIGIAAVGMLSTLGITLASNSFGPIADNASVNAQIAEMSEEVRKRTDILNSLGKTTAATGKGFAIGSAVLTVLALIGAYIEEIRMALLKVAKFSSNPLLGNIYPSPEKSIPIEKATLYDFMSHYNINLMNPVVLTGIFIGVMLVFVFCAMTMKAVGKTANSMVEEVKRQFKEITGLLKGEAKADYASCVTISTQEAQKEMVVPGILAIIIPVVVGLFLGVAGTIGMLVGGVSTGFVLAIMMANAGGAWDNAKKYIESGQLGGKGTDNHKASIVGNIVGNSFKDTAAPSLNILIKLMSMVAIVVVGMTVNYSPSIQYLIGLNPLEISNRKAYAIASGAEDSEDLVASMDNNSSIYEDPLLGTEDIILPTDDDILISSSESKNTNHQNKTTETTGNHKPTTDNTSKKNTSSGFDSGFEGTEKVESGKDTGKSNSSGGFDSGFSGGFDSFDDSSASEKKDEKKSESSSGFDSGFGGGFDSFDDSSASEKKDEKKSDSSSGFDSGFGGGFDTIDESVATEKKDEVKTTESAKSVEIKQEEPKTAEPAKVEEAPKVEEPKAAEPAKVEEAPKVEEPKAAEPAKVEEAPKVEEPKAAEPAKVEEAPKAEETDKSDKIESGEAKKAEEVIKKTSDKVEDVINKVTDIKEKIEEKKDSFEAGFDGF